MHGFGDIPDLDHLCHVLNIIACLRHASGDYQRADIAAAVQDGLEPVEPVVGEGEVVGEAGDRSCPRCRFARRPR
jgi:hypothetical protein